ncbi:MAG: hypothetical protein RML94_09990 [Bacteroidia bacterium]|nr:hypothetical protein [Bacteroidia bacterium]
MSHSSTENLFDKFYFLGVSLRCARVGVLRATLSLRCFATLRTADAPSACLTQINPALILLKSTNYVF